jgi:hypothetical protein
MKLKAIARACLQTPTMQEFPPICTSRSYWVKVCNVVLLFSYFHGHALYSGSQELICAYALMCKPKEVDKRPRGNTDDEVLLVPEAKVCKVSQTQPSQPTQPTQPRKSSASDCVCM